MSDTTFAGVDHVHRTVPDRDRAVEWYETVFGFEVAEEYESWAQGAGPLVIASPDRTVSLALFAGGGDRAGADASPLALDTDADGFLAFLDADATPVDRSDVVDHRLSYSVYLTDPWGYEYEVTTYDYDVVGDRL